MNRTLGIVLVSAGLALAANGAWAAELKVAPADNVESVLAAQKGKRVTVKLRSGQETTGTVTMVSPKLVQLSSVAGKEFFDAVVPLEAIEAVFVRTKD
jgi:hypothetical protein